VTEAGGPTGCGQMDWRFDVNQDGALEDGIDNQLGTSLEGVIVDFVDLQQEVDEGDILLLVEVSGLNDPNDDACVEVALLAGALPEGATLDRDDDGHLAPDQSFVLDRGNPVVAAQGVLEGGRLLLGPVDLTLAVSVDGNPTHFPIDPGWITFTLSEASLDVGILGGGSELDGLIDAVDTALDDVGPDVVENLLGPITDLNPDANGENCTAISLAVAFEAVTAMAAEPAE
jgi:hypothetical protein